MTREEEEEVRLLLSRHQERIMLDLGSTDLIAVLVKNSVLSQSEEDLLLKTAVEPPGSAPSSVGALTKRKLSAVASSSSGSGSGGSASVSGVGGDYSSSLAGSSRSASVNGDHAQSDNRSLTPSVGGGVGSAATESLNDAEILRVQCANLIEIIAKSGFEKFKQFCYAIECECPQLIEDLINDRLKSEAEAETEAVVGTEAWRWRHIRRGRRQPLTLAHTDRGVGSSKREIFKDSARIHALAGQEAEEVVVVVVVMVAATFAAV
ncbi:hypothetical protein AWZ03_001531 [Drosophila navojoa]|uniref:CARD domain-containing protein n=1 Tax=Drosophila navojoa TaxID=7232 RepID=A0A484BVY6_DRONA|nr:hypothetical protein AWZ03_001531 [Drosophila navojoa]